MKKILMAVAVLAVATMSACGGKESAAVKENESALKDKIENCANPDSLQVYVDQAKAYAEKLAREGKIDEAKKYLDQLTPVIQEKAPSLVGAVEAVKTALDKVPGCVADSAKCAAKQACDSAKSCAEQKAAEAVQAGKDAASAAVEKGKEAASKAANDAASKATDAINNALKK